MENGELTWRLYNAQMVYKRCAEGRTLGHFLLPFGQFTLPHPAVKIIDNRNP